MIGWQDWLIAAITFIAVMLWIVGVVAQWWYQCWEICRIAIGQKLRAINVERNERIGTICF